MIVIEKWWTLSHLQHIPNSKFWQNVLYYCDFLHNCISIITTFCCSRQLLLQYSFCSGCTVVDRITGKYIHVIIYIYIIIMIHFIFSHTYMQKCVKWFYVRKTGRCSRPFFFFLSPWSNVAVLQLHSNYFLISKVCQSFG